MKSLPMTSCRRPGPTDMAAKIDRWVVLQTIKHLSGHRSKGHDTRLFLNVTAETIQDKTFTPWLSVALKAARLPGDSLIFQIAEGDATTHLKQAKDFSRELKELHCKISISHFGCALNPFNTLKHVEADYVKIDGSFTEEIQKSDDGQGKRQGDGQDPAEHGQADHRSAGGKRLGAVDSVAGWRQLHPGLLSAGAGAGDELRLRGSLRDLGWVGP